MLTAEPRAHGSSWYGATRVESPARVRLSVELDVDVCVIGAGLAGLTAAREIARRGWSVVVLEAQSVGWDASGRNTGVVLPGFALPAQKLVERIGVESAKGLWALSALGAEYVREAARDMPGAALSETGWLHVSKTDNTKPMAAEAALLVGEFGTLIEPWSADRVREVLDSPRTFHGLHHPHGFSLHPLNYAMGLAAAAEAAGARIFEDTPVLEIDPAGVRKRIITGGARVRAAHVVLAGSVHLAALLSQFSDTLVPVFNCVIATAPLGPRLRESIRYPGAVSSSVRGDNHHRVVDGNRLMWTGSGAVRRGNPQRQARALLREIGKVYPALRGAKADYAWSGTVGETVHGMPQIGEISPGLWLLSGFGNHGLNTTAMGGDLIARAIVEGDSAWQLFTPFALVWAGGKLGRAAKQVFGWSAKANEMLAAVLARRREVKRQRAEAQAAKVRQFAGLAEAAAGPPVRLHEPIHPALEEVTRPAEPSVETLAPAAAEKPEEPFPDSPALPSEPPLARPPVAPPPAPRKPKRGPKKKKAAAQKTLADMSKDLVEKEAAPVASDQSAASEIAQPATISVDKKV